MHELITPPTRRGFLRGLSVILAAPAIVAASNLMPVSARKLDAFTGIDPVFSAFPDQSVFTFNNGDRWKMDGMLWVPMESPMGTMLMEDATLDDSARTIFNMMQGRKDALR